MQEKMPKGEVGQHKVEKDKCACQKMLNEVGVNTVPILAEWGEDNWDSKDFIAKIKEIKFPIIIKLGHIQQSLGLKIFTNKEKAIKDIDGIVTWIESLFHVRFDDGTRKWALDANVLYNALKPVNQTLYIKIAQHLGSRWVLLPAPFGAGGKTHLESSIQKFNPHLIYGFFFKAVYHHQPSAPKGMA